jgi:hypothetical protein
MAFSSGLSFEAWSEMVELLLELLSEQELRERLERSSPLRRRLERLERISPQVPAPEVATMSVDGP